MMLRSINFGDRVRYNGPNRRVDGNPFIVVACYPRRNGSGKKYQLLQIILEANYNEFALVQEQSDVKLNGEDLKVIEVPDYDVEILDVNVIKNYKNK